MGKTKGGKSKGFVSAGVNQNVANSTRVSMKAMATVTDKWLNKKRAWAAGKNPWLTVENNDRGATNARHVRVRANDHWGSPKENRGYANRSS